MTRTFVTAMYIAIAVLAISPFNARAASDTRDAYAEAIEAYEIGHYRDAISWLSIAAEDGDVRAQQLLGMMYLYGEQLYGSAVPRDTGMARAMLYRADAQGSHVARFALARMDRGLPVPATLALAPGEASGE